MRVLLAVFALAVGVSGAAQAQEIAGNFDQLRVLVRPGETIHIKDVGGHEVGGKLLDLSPDAIRILADGATREFTASEVDLITARRHGDLATGAKWGFATGAGIGALMAIGLSDGHCYNCGIAIPVVAIYFGGIGAGIGAAAAAMGSRPQVLFANTSSDRRKVSVAPIVDQHRKGAMLSVRW